MRKVAETGGMCLQLSNVKDYHQPSEAERENERERDMK